MQIPVCTFHTLTDSSYTKTNSTTINNNKKIMSGCFLQKMPRAPEYTGPDDCFWLDKEEEGVVQMLFLKKAKMFRGSMLQWGVWDIALLLVAYTISQCKNITGICWAPCLLIQQGKVLMSVFWSHLLNHHGPQSSEKFQFQIITNT